MKALFDKHKKMAEEDPMFTNVHMQQCLTLDENPGMITQGTSSDPYFNILSDYKGTSIKDLCLKNASTTEASVCVGSFKAITKASM